jgi:hypothetical protein
MTQKEITLDEFIAEQKSELDKFAAEWRENQAKEPQHWPERMPLGEWDEQLRAFDSYEGGFDFG